MKINNLKINAFGKLRNKEIELSNGINLICGENEAGKSSIQRFIPSMLYGISKNKNGKEISDFDKFKPWNEEEFSGKIVYTLDDGKSFEVYREFKKKNPIIYNSQKEDISKNFKIDKTKGIEFFIEQTGIDEEIFNSTAITEQEGIKLSKSSQNSIVQKISNLVSSGSDSISFKKTLDKINRRQNEEVGTNRTSQKPINVIENKIYRLIEEKKELDSYREKIYINSERIEKLILEERDEESKKEFLKQIKDKLDSNRLKMAEINFNKNLENEYNKKIEELNSKISEDKSSDIYEEISYKNYYIVMALFLIIFIILMFVNPYKIINVVFLIPIVFIIYKRHKDKERIKLNKKYNNSSQDKIISEIEVLTKNKDIQRLEAKAKEEKLFQEIEKEKRQLIKEYINYIDIGYIEENINKNYDDILKEIEIKGNRINTIKFEIQTMKSMNQDINNKLDDLSKIEEQIEDAESEKEELLSLNNSYNIAKECLERAYEQVKENISPRFIENLCDIISKISNNRYSNIVLNDNEGINVEIQNGSYIPVSRLSVGTIDQMYLSLRLSALNEISDETMPIILDEVFAYFDDDRLENILRYLNTNFKNNQIIIFTCSKREIEVLDKLNIDYKLYKI